MERVNNNRNIDYTAQNSHPSLQFPPPDSLNPSSDIKWTDFVNLHNKYRELVSEGYKKRDKNIRQLHNKFFADQVKQHQQQKNIESNFNNVDDWNTTAQEGINDQLIHNLQK